VSIGVSGKSQESVVKEAEVIIREKSATLPTLFYQGEKTHEERYKDICCAHFSGGVNLVFTGSQYFARQLYERKSAVVDQWRHRDGDRWRSVLVCQPQTLMTEIYHIGDRVEVYLNAKFGAQEGWHAGTIIKIDPYSDHRSFYWVQFDQPDAALLGLNQISVFNPKNIRKLD